MRTNQSPNHTERRDGGRPRLIVLHYTAMDTAEDAIQRLCDENAEVSAHYVIDALGACTALVAEDRRAWHAGRSHWAGIDDVNSWSVGIELANPGHHAGYPPFPEGQMQSLEGLLRGIMSRWRIPASNVVGHACIAPGRKIDPGEKLDWRRLSVAGLAVWLDFDPNLPGTAHAAAFQKAAGAIGYGIPQSGTWCAETIAVWQSFAMRFLPGQVGTDPSGAAVAHAERIADRWPAEFNPSRGQAR